MHVLFSGYGMHLEETLPGSKNKNAMEVYELWIEIRKNVEELNEKIELIRGNSNSQQNMDNDLREIYVQICYLRDKMIGYLAELNRETEPEKPRLENMEKNINNNIYSFNKAFRKAGTLLKSSKDEY